MIDIKEKQARWAKEKPLFEAEFIHSHLLPSFNFNENTGDYEIKSELVNKTDDEERKVAYETLNTGWAMWLRAKREAQAVPEEFVLVEKAKIKTWYQDDDEPENFCYEADGFDVLGDCLDHEDILQVNKIEDAILQTTPMYGVWKFKIIGGHPERDCFVLCRTEEEAKGIREEYRRMINLEAQEPKE